MLLESAHPFLIVEAGGYLVFLLVRHRQYPQNAVKYSQRVIALRKNGRIYSGVYKFSEAKFFNFVEKFKKGIEICWTGFNILADLLAAASSVEVLLVFSLQGQL